MRIIIQNAAGLKTYFFIGCSNLPKYEYKRLTFGLTTRLFHNGFLTIFYNPIFICARKLYEYFFTLTSDLWGYLAKEKRPSRGINQHDWSTKSNQRNSKNDIVAIIFEKIILLQSYFTITWGLILCAGG